MQPLESLRAPNDGLEPGQQNSSSGAPAFWPKDSTVEKGLAQVEREMCENLKNRLDPKRDKSDKQEAKFWKEQRILSFWRPHTLYVPRNL